MAAPVATLRLSFRFRDAKGQTARMRVLIGDATNAAVITDYSSLNSHLQAVSNCRVSEVSASAPDYVYGTNAEFPNVEDYAVWTFRDTRGGLHRYRTHGPKLAIFKSDGETVDTAQVDAAALITDMTTFVYGFDTDTGPLVFIGGVRGRSRLHRRFSIFTKAPDLAGPGE